MKRFRSVVFLLSGLLLAVTPVAAQTQKRPAAAGQEFIVRVYDVSELLAARPDYPYRGAILPTTEVQEPKPAETPGGMLGGMGGIGGGGMGGGGMGGGFFQVADPGAEGTSESAVRSFYPHPGIAAAAGVGSPAQSSFSIEDLKYAIIESTQAEWEETQGRGGTITALGTMLIVRQAPAVHEQIEEILKALQAGGGATATLTVEAWWLPLTPEEVGQLAPAENGEEPGKAGIDRAALKELAGQVRGYRGRISCFSGQTVHVVSGSRRTVVTGAIPTVGMGVAAYTPSVAYPNVGVLLQVRPLRLSESGAAILDVTSTVTGWEDAGEPLRIGATFLPGEKEGVRIAGGQAETAIDRVNMPTQHLATTVRVPLGAPVLVGGMSAPSLHSSQAGEGENSGRQLYLIVEVRAQ